MKKTFALEELDCANCAAKLERAVAMLRSEPQSTSQPMTRYGAAEAAAFQTPSSGASQAPAVSAAAMRMRIRMRFCFLLICPRFSLPFSA